MERDNNTFCVNKPSGKKMKPCKRRMVKLITMKSKLDDGHRNFLFPVNRRERKVKSVTFCGRKYQLRVMNKIEHQIAQ